jgi:hypothetical protein
MLIVKDLSCLAINKAIKSIIEDDLIKILACLLLVRLKRCLPKPFILRELKIMGLLLWDLINKPLVGWAI